MKSTSLHSTWVLALIALACDGTASQTPVTCTEARFEGGVNGIMPPRPLWVDKEAFHIVYPDPVLGIAHRALSRQTGLELSRVDYRELLEKELGPEYARLGLFGAAAAPDGALAVAFQHGIDRLLLSTGAAGQLWTPLWQESSTFFGLGWDGEGFTASLLDGFGRWGWARFSVKGEMLSNVEMVVDEPAVRWGAYDSETDKKTGTTVFVGVSADQGIYMVGRKGRQTSLTAPRAFWQVAAVGDIGPSPAVALHGNTALVAWGGRRLFIREVYLDDEQTSPLYRLEIDPASKAIQRVAAAHAGDRWVIVAQDDLGLMLVELRGSAISRRRLLNHAPGSCASCSQSDLRFTTTELSVVADGDEAWAGVVDATAQNVDKGGSVYPTYRVLPLRDSCEYRSLGSQ